MGLNLNNKVTLITGGGSGIGAAIAIKLTQEGAKVAIVGRRKNKLDNVSVACEKFCVKPLVLVADITKQEELHYIVTETIKVFGKLDLLINKAGIGAFVGILDDTAIDTHNKIMETNLHATVRLTHLAAKHIVEAKGNIVNISSIAGLVTVANAFAYCTSKAALDHFNRTVAFELGPKGVRVNSINPGPVRTDILESTGLNNDEANKAWEAMKKITLLDRVGESEEIADLVAFVVSDKARSITGAILVNDNGSVLKGGGDIGLN